MKETDMLSSAITEELFNMDRASRNERMLLDILNNIHESILVIDRDTRICFVNDSYQETFHVKREQIIGRLLSKFEPLARINEVLRSGQPAVGDISHIHSANLDVIADITPLTHDGTIIGALALMKNVTELTATKAELKHFKDLMQYFQEERSSRRDLPDAFRNVYGQSAEMVRVLKMAAKAARSRAAICITGESGTGKEVLANAIHFSSSYMAGPFIKVNCAAIPESLIESELFGYEKGAFTGARATGSPGKFEQANHGTLFLDEIGEMPLSMQVKLLRALQEQEITRVGGSNSIKLDFRLITATNRDLKQMIEEGTFREDLYYRINVIQLSIPPLRERPEDTLLYAHAFLNEMSRCYGDEIQYSFSHEALQAIQNYSWPGNVRELRNYIERAAILCQNGVIGPEHLPVSGAKPAMGTVSTLKLKGLLEQTEREAILNAMRLSGNNRTTAIELLGISRRSFYQKLEKYGLR